MGMRYSKGQHADMFGVPGENDNVKRVVDVCAERGLHLCNAYFKHNNLLKYTRMGMLYCLKLVGGYMDKKERR